MSAAASGDAVTVRLAHLYPDRMNIYADRGNLAVLHRRLAWRGMGLEVTGLDLGEPMPSAFDLAYLGGGQDRDQALVADDLAATKADALRGAVADGAVLLAVCGGYQLAGHGYTAVDGSRMAGLSILDADTVADGGPRLIGDLVIDATLDGEHHRVVGYENHAGRTTLGPGAVALGEVVRGHGNDGHSGAEGTVSGRAVGTYLHGPLLPKNPWLADLVLRWALEHRTGATPVLDPIDDALEERAHTVAAERAHPRHANR